MHLVLIETTGNQRHIFETNKLAENVGASEQLYRLGTSDVIEAVKDWLPNVDLECDVKDADKNPPIESHGSQGVEIWYLSSGKSMLLVKDKSHAEQIVSRITRKAIIAYPGVMIRGSVQEVAEFTVDTLSEAIKEIHKKNFRKRSRLLPNESRFQRLPVVAECRTSGLPASGLMSEGGGSPDVEMSRVTIAKRGGFDPAQRQSWKEQISDRLCRAATQLDLTTANSLDKLESFLDERRYVAVIHADGNGVGRIFEEFSRLCSPEGDRQAERARSFVVKMRHFSAGIDACTQLAFRETLKALARDDSRFIELDSGVVTCPLLPLVLGGDDLTVLTTGDFAMAFVPLFLQYYEQATARHPHVQPIAQAAFGVDRLGISAGVAIVKPHYPFYAAYELAEGLLSNAKRQAKQRIRCRREPDNEASVPLPVSAFDFHVHHSSSGDNIDVIRAQIAFSGSGDDKPYRLWGGPYLVTDAAGDDDRLCDSDEAQKWIAPREYSNLRCWVGALAAADADDDTRRDLPRSQTYSLREALDRGPAVANAQLNLIKHRYPNLKKLLHTLRENGSSVFWRESGPEADVTGLLDAMSLAHLGVRFLDQVEDLPFSPEATKGLSNSAPVDEGGGTQDSPSEGQP